MRSGTNQTRLFTILLFLVFAGALTAALFFKENRLWMDEILSYLLISDPSLTHLNSAVVSGFEQTPPVFANLYWLIAHTISPNVVFLKTVSIFIFSSTLALFYRYTTRLVGTPLVNFVLIAGLAAFTYLNITLATQIRSYVVFLFLGYVYFTIIHRLTRQPSHTGLLVAHVGVGLLLTLTHNFGLFYLAAAGAFFGLLWLWSKEGRYWYVLGTFGLIGVVWLLAWYPYFAVQAKTGEPHSWIPLPTFVTFFRITGELTPTLANKIEELTGTLPLLAIGRVVGLIALFGYIALPRIRRGFKAAVADPAFMLYLLAGFLYLTTLVITLVVSLVHTSVFISRYLWPSHLLVIYQLVYAFHYLAAPYRSRQWAWLPSRPVRIGWLLPVYTLGLAGFLFYQSRKLILTPTTVLAYVDALSKQYPVFLESSVNFMPAWYYNSSHRSIYFLLDHPSAFDPRNDPGATVGFHTLKAVKESYNIGAVIAQADFTPARIPHFFVVDEQWNYQIERFIQNKSVSVIRRIPTTLTGFTILECVFTDVANTHKPTVTETRYRRLPISAGGNAAKTDTQRSKQT